MSFCLRINGPLVITRMAHGCQSTCYELLVYLMLVHLVGKLYGSGATEIKSALEHLSMPLTIPCYSTRDCIFCCRVEVYYLSINQRMKFWLLHAPTK